MNQSDYQNFLQERLNELNEYLEFNLGEFKKKIKLDLDQIMLQNIEKAEREIEVSKRYYSEMFEQEMLKIEAYKKAGYPLSILSRMEESAKKRFLTLLKSNVLNWMNYIKDCQSKR